MDLSPDEFVPFIEARMKFHDEENRMQNERSGLIAAILQSGIPVYFPKKLTSHKPGEYFRNGAPEQKKATLHQLYDKMRSVAAMFGGGRV